MSSCWLLVLASAILVFLLRGFPSFGLRLGVGLGSWFMLHDGEWPVVLFELGFGHYAAGRLQCVFCCCCWYCK
jgi:hypothetical protein